MLLEMYWELRFLKNLNSGTSTVLKYKINYEYI